MEKPDVDFIDGLSPEISIEQRSASKNPARRSPPSPIYDYLRLLFARTGDHTATRCGAPIAQQTVSQIVDAVMAYPKMPGFKYVAPFGASGRKGEPSGSTRRSQEEKVCAGADRTVKRRTLRRTSSSIE